MQSDATCQTPCPQPMPLDAHMALLRAEYEKRGLTKDFEDEHSAIRRGLDEFTSTVQDEYFLCEPVGVGSTAVIVKLFGRRRSMWFAAKLPRPKGEDGAGLVEVIRTEADKLFHLDHPNVIRICDYGQLEQSKAEYYVMDFVGGTNLGNYCRDQNPSPKRLIEIAREIAMGLEHLHGHQIVHCDLKPGNILVDEHGMVRIADLGFSKFFQVPTGSQGDMTYVRFTPRYAHPELTELIKEFGRSDARAPIERERLRPEFDLYALGMSLHEVASLAGVASDTDYHAKYLALITSRLLGALEPRVAPPQGFTFQAIDRYRYASAAELIGDSERALGLVRVQTLVPELDTDAVRTVNIPGEPLVPFTDRVEELGRHPLVYRLRRVRQLGFIDYIYPGGRHSRWEHTLGAYAKACRYVKALYDDAQSPIFRSLVTERDITALVLAALLHDVGQYPLAHDLEEVDRHLFSHEAITTDLLRDDTGELATFVSDRWEVDAGRVADILDPPTSTDGSIDVVLSILHSVVDGPLDVDKLDYLYRDSVHCGVPYGLGMDTDRLIRCLTTVVDLAADKPVASIGLVEKGRISAEMMAFTRYAMFASVYWHHTYRAIKAMVRFAVSRAAFGTGQSDEPREETRRAFREEAVLAKAPKQSQLSFEDVVTEALSARPPDEDHLVSYITRRTDARGRRVLEHLEARSIFRRLLVISPNRDQTLFRKLSNVFKQPEATLEEFRGEVEQLLRQRLAAVELTPAARAVLDDNGEVLCLVDLPEERAPGIVPEVLYPPHGAEGNRSLSDSSVWRLLAEQFNETVSRFRLFIHPQLRDVAVVALRRSTIETILEAACNTLSANGKTR